MRITLNIAKVVLAQDTEPLRFERFACDVLRKLEEGAHVVTTSSNYDLGMDVRTHGRGPNVVACCSLTEDVDAKALDDAKKLKKHIKSIHAVYFCSSQKFTEAHGAKIEAQIAGVADLTGKVQALSNFKLAQYATRWPEILIDHYRAEITEITKALALSSDAKEEQHALRLALATAGTSDAAEIRHAVWSAALRLVLSSPPKGYSPGDIALRISNHLKLPSVLGPDVVRPHLQELVEAGEVDEAHGRYTLTDIGRVAYQEDEERVARNVLQGRAQLGEAIAAAIRTKLSEDQVDKMWSAVQAKLAVLFYERGREILDLLAPLLGDSEQSSPTQGPAIDARKNHEPRVHRDIAIPLAESAAATFNHPEQHEEVLRAFQDLLHTGSGPAVDWLTRACFGFVCACSLGLETRTHDALEKLINKSPLVLDTDVVLSLLSADEAAHEAVQSICQRWHDAGGLILLSKDVVFEVAYHAWIAKTDFRNVADIWPATAQDRQILSKNAFVRGFGRLLADKEARPNQWDAWIGQFRGRTRSDDRVMRAMLRNEYHFSDLPPPSGEYSALASQVREYIERSSARASLAKEFAERDEFIRRDKARRDASLFAAIVQWNEHSEESGNGEMCYLVTSSARFRNVTHKFRHSSSDFILSIPAVTYMLSMVPDRALGLTALRSFLYDERWHDRVSDFELLALRVVKRSEQFDMPWAKRSTLLKQLRKTVEGIAREGSERKGRPSKQAVNNVQQQMMTPSGQPQLIKSDRRGTGQNRCRPTKRDRVGGNEAGGQRAERRTRRVARAARARAAQDQIAVFELRRCAAPEAEYNVLELCAQI